MPVLKPGNGETGTAEHWRYIRDGRPAGSRDAPAVWFAYNPTRTGEYPQAHLKDFRRALQAAMHTRGTTRSTKVVMCLRPHAWRTHAANSTVCSSYGGRRVTRRRRVGPANCAQLKRRFAANHQTNEDVSGKRKRDRYSTPSRSGCARYWVRCRRKVYRQSHQLRAESVAALTLYVDDGTVKIDDNAAERALRAVALARKTSGLQFRRRWQTRGDNLRPGQYRQTERPCSRGLSAPRPRSHRRASRQSPQSRRRLLPRIVVDRIRGNAYIALADPSARPEELGTAS